MKRIIIFLIVLFIISGISGCSITPITPKYNTYTLHIVNQVIPDPSHAEYVAGPIQEWMGYGRCAGADSGQVWEVIIKVLDESNGNPDGHIGFFIPTNTLNRKQ